LDWVAFAEKHYMGRDRRGRLDWVAFYYDPVEASMLSFPGRLGGYGALCLLHYLYPQDARLGEELYECAMRQLGWNDPSVPVIQWADDPQMLSTAMWMARELGDTTTWDRLREISESQFEPRFFGEDNTRFAYWFGLDEPWPRGQFNATMAMIECAEPGAWSRVFNAPRTDLHAEPTLRGVDYPTIGVRRTHHDLGRRALEVDIFAATPARRGNATTFTVENLAVDALDVRLDGRRHDGWRRTGHDAVEIDLTVDSHRLELAYAQGPNLDSYDRRA
jgi:hypothetical protein